MKKKVVLTTTIILIICLSITALSGCFLFGNNDKDDDARPRHATLSLYNVYQSLTSGNIIFVISNKDVFVFSDKLEVSFNGGIDWRMARGDRFEWYCTLEDVELGAHDIVVRIAEDDKNRESKTSNTIRYTVKEVGNPHVEDIINFDRTPAKDRYKFVAEGEGIVFKRYYEEADGTLALKSVAKDDRLDLEYKFIKISEIGKDNYDGANALLALVEIETYLDDVEELPSLVEMLAMWSECSENRSQVLGWKDFDYDKGISSDEYQESIIKGFDGEEKIHIVGELVFILVRTKENATTLPSQVYAIKCWL